MSLEQDIGALVEASNQLTRVVDNKIQDIDNQLDAKAEVDEFIAQENVKDLKPSLVILKPLGISIKLDHRKPVQVTVNTKGAGFPGLSLSIAVINYCVEKGGLAV